MSWRRYFTTVNTSGNLSPVSGSLTSSANPSRTNYSSYLPDVYAGHPNRLERYGQYDTMDTDSEVNAALDILAEFCTQENMENGTPFQTFFKEQATSSEIKIIKKYLQQWTKLNKFNKRIFKIVRNAFKYGDVFFVRDPETQTWMYVDPAKVDKVIVNESEGKKPEQYHIRDFNPNFETLSTTAINPSNVQGGGSTFGGSYGTGMGGAGGGRGMVGSYPTGASSTRFQTNQNQYAIDARHVIHLSMSEGIDNNYPFGNSLLESIFKVFKQKELLEDAIIIYRVQRAPERRVFYIDVGNMPSHLAMSFVERVKNEVNQRRIPSVTGGSQTVVDSSYNPLSINEDYFFPQTCSTLDTKIKLLDDRDVQLIDLIREFEEGKENWVYAINQKTKEIEPGKIVWAGKTRLNAQLVEVLLDNGEKVTVTPDHRFIMRDGSEVEAQHLNPGDSLMPLYLHDAKTSKHQGANKYLKYTCNATGKKKWVHTMVCPKSKSGKETEIHHIDFNSRNNTPTNLVEMNTSEHRALHREIGTYHLTSAWNDPVKRNKLLTGIRNYHADDDKEMFRKRGKKNGLNTWKNPDSARRSLESLNNIRQKVRKLKTIQYSDEMCFRAVELYNQGYNSISKLTKVLRTDETFQNAFRFNNQNLLRDKNLPNLLLPTDKTLVKVAQHLGYKGWEDFKNNYKYNHSVVSVTWLERREDTGDITIESASGAHNFALTAGVFIHNSEGRGSKVEILPGGTNLGEIDDLKYFTNKLFRALRIPSSYLPTGPDDGGSNFNDGRVGTAYIQELRFNKYCERLQSVLNEKFDVEFKAYMQNKGINFDPNVFELQFNPPQNFAAYRQTEMDTARIASYTSVATVTHISKRFALKRFLGLTAEEMAENEELWKEENGLSSKAPSASAELRSSGITGGGMDSDIGELGQSATPPEGMEGGPEAAAPSAAGAPPPTAPPA
jgi:hypothetical protein